MTIQYRIDGCSCPVIATTGEHPERASRSLEAKCVAPLDWRADARSCLIISFGVMEASMAPIGRGG